MKRNIKWITYILTGTVLASLLAACGFHHHSPEDRAEWMVERTTSKLALNDAQVDKLNTLKTVMLDAGKDFRDRRSNDRDIITALISQPTLDRDQALNLVTEHTTAINAQAPQVIAALGDFYDSLDADQQAKLREFINDRMQHGRRHWH